MSEAKIQQDIVRWFNNTYCLKTLPNPALIFAVPNGGKRNEVEAAFLKATGTMAGVSDLIVVFRGKTLFIEVKADKGVQSANQKEFARRIELNGFSYFIVKSLEEFQKIISNFV